MMATARSRIMNVMTVWMLPGDNEDKYIMTDTGGIAAMTIVIVMLFSKIFIAVLMTKG